MHKETPEYVPVSLPCIPAHPLVDIKLYKKNETRLPYGIAYDPKLGYTINEPEAGTHNGTYLCVFTDNSGKKVSYLTAYLKVNTKKKTKTFLQVSLYSFVLFVVLMHPFNFTSYNEKVFYVSFS